MRAQIKTVFTFLITLLVIGSIVLVALRFTVGLTEDKCRTDRIIFENRIKDVIGSSNDYGTVREHRIPAACGQQVLCLVDTRSIGQQSFNSSYVLLNQSVHDGVRSNIFTFDDRFLTDHGYADRLHLADLNDALCVRQRGGFFEIKTQGQGRNTLVTIP